jgi:hypothetical protein
MDVLHLACDGHGACVIYQVRSLADTFDALKQAH